MQNGPAQFSPQECQHYDLIISLYENHNMTTVAQLLQELMFEHTEAHFLSYFRLIQTNRQRMTTDTIEPNTIRRRNTLP
ncbi:MAG: hypothetical protein BGO43_08415 [Gammaproteobacteria bacterium 39-13]|nr:hypothetical protein [Gammaproteobacteria bacterium]OJV96474.1 MAG: hypothetical protein BGO43_08415 [Gammaproteobacteria bacterium 39-13]